MSDMKNYRQKRMSVSGHAMQPSFAPMGQNRMQHAPMIQPIVSLGEDDEEDDDFDDDTSTSESDMGHDDDDDNDDDDMMRTQASSQPTHMGTSLLLGNQPQQSQQSVFSHTTVPNRSPPTGAMSDDVFLPPLPTDQMNLAVSTDGTGPDGQTVVETPKGSAMGSYMSNETTSPEVHGDRPRLLSQSSTIDLQSPKDGQSAEFARDEEDASLRWIELQGVHDRAFHIYFNTLTKEFTHLKPASYLGPSSANGLSSSSGVDNIAFQLTGETNEEKLRCGVEQVQKFIDNSLLNLAQLISPQPTEKKEAEIKKNKNKKASVVSTTVSSSTTNHTTIVSSNTANSNEGSVVDNVEISTQRPSTVTDGEEMAEEEEEEQTIEQVQNPHIELQYIRELLDKLHASVLKQEEVNHNKSTSAIDFMIGWDNLNWAFNDEKTRDRLEYYRASSLVETKHEQHQYNAWTQPEYFSQQPLPPLKPDFKKVIDVALYPQEFESLGLSPDPIKIEVGIDDTVEQHLKACVERWYDPEKTKQPMVNYQDYVFKVVGNNEYLDCFRLLDANTGEPLNAVPIDPKTEQPDEEAVRREPNTIWSYNTVRKSIRDVLDLKLLVVRRPAQLQYNQQQLEQIASIKEVYAGKAGCVESTDVINKDSFQGLLDIYNGTNFQLISQQTTIPMGTLNTPFNVTINGLDNLTVQSFPRYSSDIMSIYLRVTLFHGYQELPFQYDTMVNPVAECVLFQEQLYGGPQALISLLPRETRIGYMLYGKHKDSTTPLPAPGDIQLGFVVSQLVNERGILLSGQVDHALWGFPASAEGKKVGGKRDKDPFFMFRCTNWDNNQKDAPKATLRVKYPTFALPVVAPLVQRYYEPNLKMVGAELRKPFDKQHSQMLLKLIGVDPLFLLSPEHKQLLWNSRHYLTDIPSMLPRVLECVDWSRQDYRNEAYRLLKIWARPEYPMEILTLLDARFPDYRVREYAVEVLMTMDDEDLRLCLLQMVQCLKYEAYHNNPLTRFLIERAVKSPYQIGHTLYWHLKAEVHDPTCTERFAVILEELLTHIGLYMTDNLYKQSMAVLKLQKVADHVLRLKREFGYSDEETTVHYQQMLNDLNEQFFIPQGTFQVPLNPIQEATTLIVEKCRYMSSKMVPLWIVLKNSDPCGAPIYLIFKSGDDLRQDLLTLQILRVMDRLWLHNGLDNRLKPYGVIATGVNDHGEGVGMIEVVLNSTTTSDIQVKYGGGAAGALRLDPIDLFLRQNNPDSASYTQALSNFVQSSAGYCVATYVLGVGDRHNGNIMVTKAGHQFHIDFGHFLGNFKKKFGMNRERAAFVFTPEMAYVIGGRDYKKSERFKTFRNECRKSFQVLRQHAGLLETLFILMIAAGMPELSTDTDVLYMRNKLVLDLDAIEASKQLLNELKKALDSTSRRLDNLIHNMKHGK